MPSENSEFFFGQTYYLDGESIKGYVYLGICDNEGAFPLGSRVFVSTRFKRGNGVVNVVIVHPNDELRHENGIVSGIKNRINWGFENIYSDCVPLMKDKRDFIVDMLRRL